MIRTLNPGERFPERPSPAADPAEVERILPELESAVRAGFPFRPDLKKARSGKMTVAQLSAADRFLDQVWRVG